MPETFLRICSISGLFFAKIDEAHQIYHTNMTFDIHSLVSGTKVHAYMQNVLTFWSSCKNYSAQTDHQLPHEAQTILLK